MAENSITFGDGSVILLEKEKLQESAIIIKIKNKTNIESIITSDYDNFSFIDVLKIYRHKSFTVYIGEGSYGGDGFIYLTDNKSSELVWFAFFDFSDPFVDVIINNDQIITTTNNDRNWTFLLKNPELINVE